MKIKGAIFDLDGTLLESMHIWRFAGPRYLESIGIESREDISKSTGTKTLAEAAEYLKKKYSIPKSVKQIIDEINNSIENAYFNEVELKECVPELLTSLKDNGVKICIATLTDTYLVKAALKRLGILHFFDNIFSCADTGIGKDSPDIYYKAAESMGVLPHEALVFEDAIYAMKTAKAAGFPVMAIYDRWCRHSREEIEKVADVYFTTFAQWDKKHLL